MVDWSRCNLSGADLSGADLFNSAFNGANLSGAQLIGANFSDVYQLEADLTGADLSRADVSRVNFLGSFVTCSDIGNLGTGILGTPTNWSADWAFVSGTLSVPIVPCPEFTAPVGRPQWLQSIGRGSVTAPCLDGYTGSWAMWQNNGTGGYVCDRFTVS